jgi:hypothetical protein
MGKVDVDAIWKMVQENSAKLKSCKYHKFLDMDTDNKWDKKYVCVNCGGTLDLIKKFWYEEGIRHEKDNEG